MRYLFACILIIVMGCVAWLLTGTRQAETEAKAQRCISEPLPNTNKGSNTYTHQDTVLTDPLQKVGEFTYERSVMIPMKVRQTEWGLLKNRGKMMADMVHVAISNEGKVIKISKQKSKNRNM